MRSNARDETQGMVFLVGAALLLVGLAVAGLLLTGFTAAPAEPLNETSLEYEIHQSVNEERTNVGLEPLTFDNDLRPIAASFSQQMAEENFFAHESPTGETFRDRYESAGYECNRQIDADTRSRGGENLAKTAYNTPVRTEWGEVETYTTTEELAAGVVESWMQSEGHRENMLSEDWARQGIGVYITDSNTVYVTQNFC